MEDDEHLVWLYMSCGLVRIASSELDNWANDAKHKVQATFLDASDGVRTAADPTGYSPQVSKAPDGRIYFVTLDGVSVIDPRHLPFNTLPPPVHVEQINADHKTYDASSNVTGDSSSYLRLPPLVRDLEIEYTALSLVAPEKVRFRYKLEGRDRDWQDVGTRRQAFYTDLSPGPYRFRVIASNNSGVWNEAGASLDFSITPAYYQTLWFRLCVVAALLSVVGALYQLRQRQIVGQFNMRLEERVSERTRIARDLHDTLLQSFHGVLLRFQSAAILLPDRPVDARKALESGIDQAAEALAEGRDAVQGLRSSVVATKDLPSLMSALGEELTADRTDQHAGDFRVQVEGTPRDFAPLVQDEVYWIAREALRNAFRHAHAGRIQVEVRFDSRRFRLRVRDDGKGMDQAVVDGGGRSGHYGLAGMRERARLLRGTLAIWSELDSGTEVELTIPGSVAYAKSPVARPAKYSGEVVG
jgi:signal transduction histidine kinase